MQVVNTGSSVVSFRAGGTNYVVAASASVAVPDKYMSEMQDHAAAIPALTLDLAVSAAEVVDNNAAYAPAVHNHTGVYLPVAGTAADSDKLGGSLPNAFAAASHTHAPSAGTWANRPTADLVTGQTFFATDENTLWAYNSAGSGTKWFAAGVEHV